ncbi:sulfatase [bacterium]|nr:sulfatase [bacterium]
MESDRVRISRNKPLEVSNLLYTCWFGLVWGAIEAVRYLPDSECISFGYFMVYLVHILGLYLCLTAMLAGLSALISTLLGRSFRSVFCYRVLLLVGSLCCSIGLVWAYDQPSVFSIPGILVCILVFVGCYNRSVTQVVLLGVVLPVLVIMLLAAPRLKQPICTDSGVQTSGLSDSVTQTNCILISVDTLRADYLGCYGHEQARTPVMDRLSRGGQLYTQVQSPQALTGPAHASMISGRYPREHGCRSNGDPVKSPGMSLALFFTGLGYRTMALVSGYPLKKEFFDYQRHFQVYDDKFSPAWFPPDFVFRLPLVRFLADRGLVYDRRYLFECRGVLVNRRVERSLTDPVSPFFLFVHYYEPHGPYEPPAVFANYYYPHPEKRLQGESMSGITFPAYQRLKHIRDIGYPRAMYLGEVSYVDYLIGDMLRNRVPRFLLEHSLVVLTADHAESLGEHDYYFDHGRDCFQASLHVPLILRKPVGEHALLSEQLVCLTDIPDLICRALDQRPFQPGIERAEGDLTLLPGSDQDQPIPLEANSNLLRHSDSGKSLQLDHFAIGVRHGPYKLIEDLKHKRTTLYDLENDPSEKTDISASHPELVRGLMQWLAAWQSSDLERAAEIPGLSPDQISSLEQLGYIHE